MLRIGSKSLPPSVHSTPSSQLPVAERNASNDVREWRRTGTQNVHVKLGGEGFWCVVLGTQKFIPRCGSAGTASSNPPHRRRHGCLSVVCCQVEVSATCLFVCLSVCLIACLLFDCLSVCLFDFLIVCCVCLSVYLIVYLFVRSFVCYSVCWSNSDPLHLQWVGRKT
jgi:hypothetical protein